MARPRLNINPDQVAALASIGCTEIEVATVLDCSAKTIHRRFVQHFLQGKANLKTKLRKKQVEMALAGNVSLLMWLGKQYLDQTDKQELMGKGGESLVQPASINYHFADGTVIKPPRNGHEPADLVKIDGDGHKTA